MPHSKLHEIWFGTFWDIVGTKFDTDRQKDRQTDRHTDIMPTIAHERELKIRAAEQQQQQNQQQQQQQKQKWQKYKSFEASSVIPRFSRKINEI